MMSKLFFKKFLAVWLMVMMLFSSMPLNVLADEIVELSDTEPVEEFVSEVPEIELSLDDIVSDDGSGSVTEQIVNDVQNDVVEAGQVVEEQTVVEEAPVVVDENSVVDDSATGDIIVDTIGDTTGDIVVDTIGDTTGDVTEGTSGDSVGEIGAQDQTSDVGTQDADVNVTDVSDADTQDEEPNGDGDVVDDIDVVPEDVVEGDPLEDIVEEVVEAPVEELVVSFVTYPTYTYVGDRIDAVINITGGKAPYVVNSNGVDVAFDIGGEQIVNAVPEKWGQFKWKVIVTDALGTCVDVEAAVLVSSDDMNTPPSLPELKSYMTFAERLVAVALSQIGYEESESNFIVRDDGSIQGWSFYGSWYGMPYEEWCAMFVSYCLEMAGIPENAIPRCANNQRWKEKLGNKYIDNEDEYQPEPGDIVFFHHDRVSNDPNFPNHVGIVTKVNSDGFKISTVEGNTGKAVKERKYETGDTVIVGYVSMRSIMEKYDPNYEIPEESIVDETVDVVGENDGVVDDDIAEDSDVNGDELIDETDENSEVVNDISVLCGVPQSVDTVDNMDTDVDDVIVDEDLVSDLAVNNDSDMDVSDDTENGADKSDSVNEDGVVPDSDATDVVESNDNIEEDSVDGNNVDENDLDANDVGMNNVSEDVNSEDDSVDANLSDNVDGNDVADNDVVDDVVVKENATTVDNEDNGDEYLDQAQNGTSDEDGNFGADGNLIGDVSDLDTQVSEPNFDTGVYLLTTADRLNMRSEPDGDIIGVIVGPGTRVMSLNPEEIGVVDWYHVLFDGTECYCSAQYLVVEDIDDSGNVSEETSDVAFDSDAVTDGDLSSDNLSDDVDNGDSVFDNDMDENIDASQDGESSVSDENNVVEDNVGDNVDDDVSSSDMVDGDVSSDDENDHVDAVSDNVVDETIDETDSSDDNSDEPGDDTGEPVRGPVRGPVVTDNNDNNDNGDSSDSETDGISDNSIDNTGVETGDESDGMKTLSSVEDENDVDADGLTDEDGLDSDGLRNVDGDGEGEDEPVVYEALDYTYEGNGMTVVASTSPENEIPSDAVLVVSVVGSLEERVAGYVDQIASVNGVDVENVVSYVYEIHFESVDGDEISVAAGEVSVSVTFDEALTVEANHIVPFYHVVNGSLVRLVNSVASNGTVVSFSFAVGSFSDFVMADVDLTTYDYDNKYAILYSNGDLVFQQGNRPDESKGDVVTSWTGFDNGQTHPWSGRTDVKKVIYDVDVKIVNATSYFEGMSELTQIVGLEHLDTSTVRSFSRMFHSCSKLINNDFDKLNTDMAKTCGYMFYGCQKIGDFDYSKWTLSDVTNLEYMFYNCDKLTNVDLSSWVLSNVTSLSCMFNDCDGLISCKMAGDMSKVTSTQSMFYECNNLLLVDMDTCYFPKLSSAYWMFGYCSHLETVKCSSWDMSKLSSCYYMFYNCQGLKNLDIADWNINGNNLYSYYMFYNCSSLVELDFGDWTYSLIEPFYIFEYCSKLRKVDMGNVYYARSYNNYYGFYGCTSLEQLDLSDATTVAQSSGLSYFLYNTRKLAYVDLSGFDTTAGGSTQGFFVNSGISKVTLGPNWRFSNTTADYQLPAGSWRRVSTGDVYTAEELARVWNSEMADTYEKVASISFDPQGGSASKRRVVKYLSEPIYDGELPTATRDGYTFLGWFTDPEGGTQLQVGDVPDKIVYYAHWSENEYTLILKRNVEDDPNDTDVRYNLLYSEIFQLDPSIFENDDRVIQAWTTNADGSGTSYGADAEVAWLSGVDGGTATLYAKWGRTRFATINFDSQGGMEIPPIVIERGQQLTPLMYSMPNRTDYTFMGWYTAPEGGTRWDTSNHTVTESRTLYAHWSRNPVISFDPNGGWVEYLTKQVPYGSSLGVLPNAEARPEKLIGYYTSQTPGEGTKLTTSTVFTEDTTYYAHWGYQPEFKTVGGKFVGTFDLNSVYPVAYEREQTIHTLPQVTRDGYRFVKWILSDGTEVHEGDVVDIYMYPDITAVWELDDQVTVTFDPDGGSMVGGGTRVWKVRSGDMLGYYPYASKSISGRNAEFLGWFDENDNEYFADTVITENVALKAKYNSRIYTNTFVTNNPSFTRSPIYLGVNEPFGVVPGLQTVNGTSVSGQYLEGWYTSADPFEADGVTLKEGVVKLTPETTVSEDTTWYARILNNKVDDVHEGIAYTYYAEWSNASNTYLDNSDNNLDFHPNSSSNIVANLHLHFELNGAVSGTLPVGDVRISIPKYVFKDWDDRDVGTNNLSAQIPVFPRVQSGMWFSYIDKGDHYEIVNNQPISGGAGVDLTVAYSVAPYLVPGGAVDRNGDYVPGYDFYQADIPVLFEMGGEYEVDSANGTISYTSSDVEKITDLSLEVHTKAEPYISKSASNVYYEWQSSWGPKPADADDYFYISWSVPTYAQNSSTYYTYRVSEDTLHDGTVVADDVLNVGSQATNSYRYTNGSWYYMYPVIKYEKSLLENPPSTGVTFENQAKIELTTRAGYTIETIAKGTYTMHEWKYTKGEFDKTNTHSGVYQLNGGQDKLLDDQSLDLTWELHYDGNSADTPIFWDDEAQSYHRDQRVISIADGVNSDLFLSSGEPSSKYAWEPTTGNYVLSDNDYRINSIRIYTKEYDGSLINDEWGGPTIRSDYQNWKDIDIYVRHANSNDLVFYKSVRPWATYSSGVGSTSANGYTDVTLPADAVGYEVRYPTRYFSTYMQVYMYATVFPTTKVKSLVASDVAKNVYTEIKNRGYCNIWTSDDPYTDPDPKSVMFYPNTWTRADHPGTNVFFHVSDWTGGFNGANKEIYELTKTNASIYVRKNASDQGNVVFDVERGFQENPMVIYGWNYASNFTAYMQRGVFYDLLPLGATVNEETIFGIPFVYNGTSASYSANNYNSASTSSDKLAKAYYSVEFIENWEGSGRMMMQISFMMPPSGKYNAVRFYYKQKMSYADVINYGTSVENDVAFVDLTDGTYVYNSESQTLVNAQFAEPDLFLPIERANDHPAYYKARSNYLPVDAFSWGFSKAVKTKDYYTDSDTTIPNNLYTYRLTFAQSDFATSDSIVFFDVFENGAYGVDDTPGVEVLTRASDWHGVFESIDIASLRTKLKANTTDIHLNPVVYYSTKDRDTFTGEDWNVANSATWSTVKPANNADITAVAVDCTKSSDGSDFIMSGRETMSIYITMRAPSDEEYIDTSAVNQARFRGNLNNESSEATSDTTVTYTEEEPEIHKSSDPETGTQDDPAVMSAGQELVYTITVKNKNQEFTVPNIVVEDDVPDELLIDKNNIKVHFGNPSAISLLSINPRVDLTSTGNHLKFNINTLASNETCYLLIPCTAKAVGNVVIENTSKITSVNGVDKDIDSETTYHKIRYDILFSKQSDQKRLVIGAILQLWDMDGDPEPVLVEEWVTGTSNKVIQLDPGNFKLVETDVPSGYKQADDILFTIETDGTVRFEDDSTDTKVIMVDVESTTVKGVKHWKWDQESDRPESITVKLMRTIDEAVAPVYADMSIDVTADDNWAYDFGLVPKYDPEGHEYIYSVQEEHVAGYTDYYTDSFETNGLALTFSNKTKTYNSSDYFKVFYKYGDRWFASPSYYGPVGGSNNPGGSTIYIPANDFYVIWYTDGSGNDYGFKFDQILPVVMDVSQPFGTRQNMPAWTNGIDVEEYSGSRYPETDHEYFVYEKMVMHYSRESEGNVLDIVNTKNNPKYDVPIDKVSEDGDKLGGITLRVTSIGDVGDAQIDPIEWVTVEDQSKLLELYPGRYLLHEVACIDGYQFADDIEFVVNGVGEISVDDMPVDRVVMVDKYAVNKYPFRKAWMDDGYEALRPSSIEFELVRASDSEVVQTAVLTAEDAVSDDVWEGYFEDVLIVDENWEPIDYDVRETNVSSDYHVVYGVEDLKGFLVTFTDDSHIGNGRLYIVLFNDGHNGYLDGVYPLGYLNLNSRYGFAYLEDRDVAGRTFYVPNLGEDSRIGFWFETNGETDFNLEIASIVPTSHEESYSLINGRVGSMPSPWRCASNTTYNGVYPDLNSSLSWTGSSYRGGIWCFDLATSNEDWDGSVVLNMINKQDVPFEKRWDDAGHESSRPSELTFDLYNVNDLDSVVATKTVSVGSGDYSFAGVPLYNSDGSYAQYTVKERAVDNYIAYSSLESPKGFLVTFSDDSYIAANGYLNIYSIVELSSGDLANSYSYGIDWYGPSSYNSSLYSYSIAGKTVYIPVLSDDNPGFYLYLYDSTKMSHISVESVVPVDFYRDVVSKTGWNNRLDGLTGTVFEGNHYPSASLVESDSNTARMLYKYNYKANVVTNVYSKTSIPVHKIWSDYGSGSDRPDSVIFDVYNVLDEDVVVKSVTFTADDCQVADDEWYCEIDGLDRFNEDGTPAFYGVREQPIDGYASVANSRVTGMLVTFSEDSYTGANGSVSSSAYQIYTVRNGMKADYLAWKYQSYGSTYWNTASYFGGGWLSGRTIFVPVFDDVYAFVLYNSYNHGGTVKIESIQLTTSDAYEYGYGGYSGTSLSSMGGTVIEGSSNIDLTGKTGNILIRYNGVTDYVYDGGYTIVNESDKIGVPVSKVWSDVGYEDERPDSITFNVYNRLDEDTVVGSVELTADDSVAAYEWGGCVTDLPRYNDDGTLAEYIVREVSVDGYTSSNTKPTGMYITFSKDTLNGYQGEGYITNSVWGKNYYIQVYSVDSDPRHMNYRYTYQYPGVNTDNSYGYLYKKDLEALNYRVYIPIQYDGDYQFCVYQSSYGSLCTVKVEKVELTTDVVPCTPIYYSGSSMPYEPGEKLGTTSGYLSQYIYRGHGACDMTNTNYIYRYVYDGVSNNSVANQVVNEINKTTLTVDKLWSDVGYEDRRPDSITINVYNVNDDDTIVRSVELTVDDAVGDYEWNTEIKGLPKYNDDGTLAVYRYEEEAVEDYIMVPGEPKGMLVTLSEDSFEYVSDSQYIQFYSVHGGYTYQLIRNDGDPTSIYRSNFKNRASRTFYVPIVAPGEYEFAIYKSSNWWANKLEIESVQLTSVEQKYYVEGTSYVSLYSLTQSNIDQQYCYVGHGSAEFRNVSGYLRYVYDGATGNLHNLADMPIVNEISLTDLPITKNWLDEGHETERPESITIDIYNILDMDTVVQSVELTSDDADGDYVWRTVATDLPKYNSDYTLANYVIQERPVENYHASYSKPKGLLVTISKDSVAQGSVTLYALSDKASKFRYTLSYPINGSTYTSISGYTLRTYQNTFYVPIVDDGFYAFGVYYSGPINNQTSNKIKIEKVELTTVEQPYSTSGMGMPFYSYVREDHQLHGDGSPIYLNADGSSGTGYSGYWTYKYEGPDSAIGKDIKYSINSVVTNEYDRTSYPFEKRWNGDDGYEYMRPNSITFQLFNDRDSDVVVSEVTLNKSDFDGEDVWSGTFENIPKYNDDGTLAVYFVKEKVVPDGYTSVSANKDIKGFLLKFNSDCDVSNGYMYIWQSNGERAVNYVSPSTDNSPAYWYGLYYPLHAMTMFVPVHTPGVYEFWIQLGRNSQSNQSDLKTAKYTIESIVPVYDDDFTSYIYTNSSGPLASYTTSGTARYETVHNATSYSRDVGISNGYNVIYTLFKYDVDSSFDGVMNSLEKFPVEFNKCGFEQDYLAGAHLQVLRNNTVIDEWDTVAGENHIVELPYGTYVLHETASPEGYDIASDIEFTVGTNGSVTVTKVVDEEPVQETVTVVSMFDNETIDIPFDKYWDDADYIRYRPSSLTFDLYDKSDMETVLQTVVLTADDKVEDDIYHWSGEFTDLPRCRDDGSHIEYVIRERSVRYYNTEYSGEHFVVNSSDRFTYTPKYGMKINWTTDARTNGPLCVIWKDKMSGLWYMTGYGLSVGNSPLYLNAQEAYLLYHSYGYYTGIAIESVELNKSSTLTMTGGTVAEATDRDEAIRELVKRFQGTSNYWDADSLSASDFVDGSNGYRDNVASTPWIDSSTGTYYNVNQLVKVSIPSNGRSYVSRGINGNEILNAEGFRITYGDDAYPSYGPYATIWRDAETGKLAYSSSTPSAGQSYDIPSKEFYLFFKDCGSSTSIRNTGITLKSVKAISGSSSWVSGSVTDYDTIEDFMSGVYSGYSSDLVVVDGRYGVSADAYTTENRVYSFVYSAQYEPFTSEDPVEDDVVISNVFDLHTWPVSLAKKDVGGNLIGEAHLKLYNSSNELVAEWDSGSGSAHVENLWPGSYVLKETSVPPGYVKGSDVSFTLTPIGEVVVSGSNVSSVDIVNTDTVVSLAKKDDEGNFVSGAQLILYSSDISVPYESWTSGSSAHVVRNLPAGTWTLHEVSSPVGYIPADDVVFVLSDQDGSVKVSNVVVTSVVMTDNIRHVMIRKLGAFGDLAGVIFEISGVDFDEDAIDLSGVTAKSNNVVLTDLSSDDTVLKYTTTGYGIDLRCVPVGHYVMHETVTVDGYTYADDVEFDVASDGTVTIDDEEVDSVDMQNTQTFVNIRKEDINGDLLPEATLQILDEDDEIVVDNWETSDEVDVFTGVLNTNTVYKLHEVDAPEGYNEADDILFKIDSKGNVLIQDESGFWVTVSEHTIVMVDTSVHSLSLHKQVTGLNGNKKQPFNFTVVLKDANNHYIWSAKVTDVDGSTSVVDAVANGQSVPEFKFTLMNGQSVVFEDLYNGTTYTVTEDDYSDIKYDTTVSVDLTADDGTVTEGLAEDSLSATGVVEDNNHDVTFENNRAMYVQLPSTGYLLDLRQMVMMIGFAGLVLLIVYWRKKKDNSLEK